MGRQIVSPECSPIVGYNDFAPAIGVWDWDVASNLIYGDEAVAKVFGLDSDLTKKGLPPESYFANIHHDDRQMIIDHSMRSIATNGACSDNFRIVSPGAGSRWVNSQGRAFPDRHNNPRCFVGLISEIAPQNAFDHAETSIFPGGSADDDVLYLCLHAKRIAMNAKRPFLEYLLEMVMAEVTDSRVMHKC